MYLIHLPISNSFADPEYVGEPPRDPSRTAGESLPSPPPASPVPLVHKGRAPFQRPRFRQPSSPLHLSRKNLAEPKMPPSPTSSETTSTATSTPPTRKKHTRWSRIALLVGMPLLCVGAIVGGTVGALAAAGHEAKKEFYASFAEKAGINYTVYSQLHFDVYR